jgi:hypothetical protein
MHIIYTRLGMSNGVKIILFIIFWLKKNFVLKAIIYTKKSKHFYQLNLIIYTPFESPN